MNLTTVPQIAEFAAAVRQALADLPAEEVEELTDGLEADLAEAFSEDLARELPDPGAYADELRAAAGLPRLQQPKRRATIRAAVAEAVTVAESRASGFFDKNAATQFVASLRPAWWIVRGWVAFQVVAMWIGGLGVDLLPTSLTSLAVMLVMVAGSVFLGWKSWPTWLRVLIWFGNAFAVLMLLVSVSSVPTNRDIDRTIMNFSYGAGDSGEMAGVSLDGNEVTNIFAYGADGKPLSNVQLFDQDGNPLRTSVPGVIGCLEHFDETEYVDGDDCKTPGVWVPNSLETGAKAWNVYPMQMIESTPDDPDTPAPGVVAQDRPAPFLKVPALLLATPDDQHQGDETAKDSAAKKSNG